jgi:hypothetical protein
METNPISETLCFLFFRIPDDDHSPKTQRFWVLYTIDRTLKIVNAEMATTRREEER